MDVTDKVYLHHDFSECSTHFLGEGSLSCLISDEGVGGNSLDHGPVTTSNVFRGVAPRQPMVLLQLKRLAPKAGRLTMDCSQRVPRADRHYDLLVEPGESKESEGHAPQDPVDEGEPWQRSLRNTRSKKKVSLRPLFKASKPPMELAAAFRPRSKQIMRPRKSQTAPLALRLLRAKMVHTPDETGTYQARIEVTDEDAMSHDSGLGLPASLNEDEPGAIPPDGDAVHSTFSGGLLRAETTGSATRSKELVHWAATWPLGVGEVSTTLSLSSSGGKGSVQLEPRKSTLALPLDHHYSGRRLSERRRSWLKANEANKGRGPGFSQRTQVREMVSTMMKTMTQTFERSVWDACDVLHPDEELEKAHAKQKKVLEDQIDQFKGLKPAIKGRRRSQRRESTRRSFGITAGMAPVTSPSLAEKPDEKVLAHLAKQTGWSVLDVEEVWEIFISRAPSGRIGVQSQDFIMLVQEIYHGVTDEEIMLLQQHMKAVRTRNKARSRYMRRALTGGLDMTQDRSDVRFSEFYVALVKWLDLQLARDEASVFWEEPFRRCSLKRFSYREAYENVSTSPDLFRGSSEVIDFFDSVQGVAQALLRKKSQLADREEAKKAALLDEDSNSDADEKISDEGEDNEDPSFLVVQNGHHFHVSRSARSSSSSGGGCF